MEKIMLGQIKWGVSRGRDTYGYNICTLYVDGKRVASCNGGGYDMRDACFSEWLNKEYSARMQAYCATKKSIHPEHATFPEYRTMADGWADGHFFFMGKSGWRLDGGNGCAIDSARKLGIEIKETLERKRGRGMVGTGLYTIVDKGEAE